MNGAVLVDGYNALLGLARRERVDVDRVDLAALREEFVALLAGWAALRGLDVTVAFDGLRSLTPPPDTLRVVYCEPPAEADDWIAGEARRLTESRVPCTVVTHDRGLRARLPRAVAHLALDDLAADLEALHAGPLVAPHVHGPGGALDELPASMEPVDTSRLPRRRVAPVVEDRPRLPGPPPRGTSAGAPRAATGTATATTTAAPRGAAPVVRPAAAPRSPVPAPSPHPTPAARTAADAEAAGRAAAREKRDAARARFERARARKAGKP